MAAKADDAKRQKEIEMERKRERQGRSIVFVFGKTLAACRIVRFGECLAATNMRARKRQQTPMRVAAEKRIMLPHT